MNHPADDLEFPRDLLTGRHTATHQVQVELFGRSISTPADWPPFEPEELSERAAYEQTSLSQLDYQSTVAPSRQDLASLVLRLDTYNEDVPEQIESRRRGRSERRQRWPHHEPNSEPLASDVFFYNRIAEGVTCFWYYSVIFDDLNTVLINTVLGSHVEF